ncbi:hypothetical protein A3A46_02325 [Candidatus Roizmanbacteria bacterium RIFCSPLOWO2_01_FULL_37_13]|uniref:DUF5678 domain-containing protein n=1 Tax=Candidatus Roizmanbacteria bacterium RIFCSPHIGHO2_02_FULL_38_11 TaxID=1802039 RepID=A0A1F7H253_9BACT|nr:MAG: hypothetical protein A3C25_03725 [Candidatus Roizmanbacteria bacterium RIFCSPHIGHO2_02_FULL_38_11]OGK35306.1 MAG: hypothetical protein A3F58_03380 [Candidatus Roizmanbacteria bacterium RIFCSPHIGHO2_12_FULL_37_9b]OGK41414.1 MAG: hypothetical protein A3A46_02325 [Candidatus Roizmanbacteria bacterium RIFCSPLOWO2_01_FULL_37_13]
MSISIGKKGEQIVKKGEKIYYKIKPELEKKYDLGYYVTIEVDTGKFFVGKTSIEALHKAKKAFPRKQFFLAQVGRVAGLLYESIFRQRK